MELKTGPSPTWLPGRRHRNKMDAFARYLSRLGFSNEEARHHAFELWKAGQREETRT